MGERPGVGQVVAGPAVRGKDPVTGRDVYLTASIPGIDR